MGRFIAVWSVIKEKSFLPSSLCFLCPDMIDSSIRYSPCLFNTLVCKDVVHCQGVTTVSSRRTNCGKRKLAGTSEMKIGLFITGDHTGEGLVGQDCSLIKSFTTDVEADDWNKAYAPDATA